MLKTRDTFLFNHNLDNEESYTGGSLDQEMCESLFHHFLDREYHEIEKEVTFYQISTMKGFNPVTNIETALARCYALHLAQALPDN